MTRMLCRVITAAGLEVESFSSAEDFLSSSRLNRVSCLILDMNLPGISGGELQRRLRDAGFTIPVIFISAEATEEIRQRVVQAGAVELLSKPFSIDSLLATVRSVTPQTAV
jgi:FixJ family two-component response regulator